MGRIRHLPNFPKVTASANPNFPVIDAASPEPKVFTSITLVMICTSELIRLEVIITVGSSSGKGRRFNDTPITGKQEDGEDSFDELISQPHISMSASQDILPDSATSFSSIKITSSTQCVAGKRNTLATTSMKAAGYRAKFTGAVFDPNT